MWKYNNQKGQDLIEYALLLAIVVGIGSFIFSGSGLKDSISSIFGNSSSLLGNVASASKDPSSNLSGDDRNMKWLKDTLMGYINEKWFQDQVGYALTTRKDMDFTKVRDDKFGGLSDSESNSNFMDKIDDSYLGDCIWVMTEYTENGNIYYGVSIYDPSKNGGQKLSDLTPGPEGIQGVTTDVNKIDTTTGDVTKYKSDAKQNVFKKTNNTTGTTYNVIRGNPK